MPSNRVGSNKESGRASWRAPLVAAAAILAVAGMIFLNQLFLPAQPPHPVRHLPPDAALLFGGEIVTLPSLEADQTPKTQRRSEREFGDFKLHTDFFVEEASDGAGGNAENGFRIDLAGRYRLHLSNSVTGACGLLGSGPRLADACSQASSWRNLQVVFRAARFSRGQKRIAARATVFLDNVAVHDNAVIDSPSVGGAAESGTDGPLAGPLVFTSPTTRVRLANAWVEPLSAEEEVFFFSEPAPPSGKEWLDMDYGPFLTASIEAPQPPGNIAYKGIALPMDRVYGEGRDEAVIFDTDLLRYSVFWKGDFVDLKGVVYDGTHQTHPAIQGEIVFSNPVLPGWAQEGRFEDPRRLPYGPLPRHWAHYRGLYLHGNRVVFSYTVGETEILDMPGLDLADGGLTAFSRSLQISPSTLELQLQVATVPAGQPSLLLAEDLQAADSTAEAGSTLAILTHDGQSTAAIARGAPAGSRWVFGDEGDLRLRIPPSRSELRLELLVWKGTGERLSAFAALGVQEPDFDLKSRLAGGPRRWRRELTTEAKLGDQSAPYTVDTLTWPERNPWRSWMRFGGFDFFPDGRRAALCTWSGDVWIVEGVAPVPAELTWRRIATGLFQPLGLKIVDQRIYVLGRDQITILHDLNGDGESDFYENFNNDHQVTEHFHEFAMDLQVGPDGDFYYMKGGRHALDAVIPQHGTLIRVSRDGARSEILASGFRAPNGLAITPDGRMISSDQQGHWVPANRINLLQPGGFYGYMWSFHQGERPTRYDPPLAWIHPSIDRSPSTFVWVDSRRWGPFGNRLVSLSYGMGKVDLVLEEEVDGVRQGGLTRLPVDFDTGVMRGRFHPGDGQLYVAGLYGWAGNKTRPGGFYRIRYTGKPLLTPTTLEAARDGVVIGFTEPLDEEIALDRGSYHVQVWNYRWSERYGSPDLTRKGEEGREVLAVRSVALSKDRRRVFLELSGITPAMQMHIDFNLRSVEGVPSRTFVHNTVHRLGRESGLEKLGAGWVSADQEAVQTPTHPGPGLIQEIRSLAGGLPPDVRRARLAALYVSAGEPPSRLSPPGPFRSRWRGYLKSDLNQRVRLHLEGRGSALLRINGESVLDAEGSLEDSRSAMVSLRGGLNSLDLDYQTPVSGNAELRLGWSSSSWRPEPVPPEALVHDSHDPALGEMTLIRTALRLFADHHCLNCHRLPRDSESPTDPRLGATAVSLDGAGRRLRRDWLVKWIADPSSLDPLARMPRLKLSDASAAADIAAFLSGPGNSASEPFGLDQSSAVKGEQIFEDLGCRACHSLEEPRAADRRLGLGRIAAKWRPQGLIQYLLDPDENDPWSAMPDYGLENAEAEALAHFLLRESAPSEASLPETPWGDPRRGGELVASLGCAGCHQMRGVSSKLQPPGLPELVGKAWNSGCLANGEENSQALRFSFETQEREALVELIKEGVPGLDRIVWSEFAEEQLQALRCGACHETDSTGPLWSPDDGAAADGDAGSIHLRVPPLTWVGEKLRPEWTEALLEGSLRKKPRPRLTAKMPAFAAYARGIGRGLAQVHGFPPGRPATASVEASLGTVGKALIETTALGCIQCHPAGQRPNLAGPDTETINLALIPERLRLPFYLRFMRDPQRILRGTMMPAFLDETGKTGVTTYWEGDGERQARALWEFMKSLDASSNR